MSDYRAVPGSDEAKVLYDSQGRPRSRATMPEFAKGRKPKNAGRKWPPQVLPHREVLKLIDTWSPTSASGSRNRAMFWLIYAYDLKSVEVRSLSTWDYLEDERRLRVPAILKGRAERVVALDAFTVSLLRDWFASRDRVGISINDPLFCTAEGQKGRALEKNTPLVQALTHARKKAGIRRRVTTEGLRLSGRQRQISLDAIESEAASRANIHLRGAWDKLQSGPADFSGAYREAVRAVEAAAKPVIEPNNRKATLGTMLGLLRAHPDRWQITLGDSTDLHRMMAMLWTSQLDRHGTDDETVPLHVNERQTDMAVHMAIALCRIFTAGHVTMAT